MNAIVVINREMIDTEFARLQAGMEENAGEHGRSTPTEEDYGCVALDGETFIGCAKGVVSRYEAGYAPWCYLSDLYVEKPYRGQGHGAALLRRVEQRAAALGIGQIWTWTAGYEAPGFYRKQGYEVFCEQERFYFTGHSRVGLRKALQPVPISTPDVPVMPEGRRALSKQPASGSAIRLQHRDMTEAEFARMNAGFDAHSLEHGNPIEAAERHGFVAMDGEQFVGAVSGLAYRSERGYNPWFAITDLFVEQVYRQRGAGALLLRNMEEQAGALGIRTMWIWEANPEAQGFFRKQDYELCCRLTMDTTTDSGPSGLRKQLPD